MKIIVSHDVDHLFLKEHFSDGFLFRYIGRTKIELLKGRISLSEFVLRIGELFKAQWHHIDEIMDFDKENDIPSTFFWGMVKGKGLNYTFQDAAPIVERIIEREFEVGVHGIEEKDVVKMKTEYERFSLLIDHQDFGIRMHYLNHDQETIKKLAEIGYVFDSTMYEQKNPFQEGKMWEFPLQLMDVHEYKDIESTKQKIEEAKVEGIKYLSLLFHDRYFCKAFPKHQQWYKEIIAYCRLKGFEFVSYREAVKELNADCRL